MSSPNIPPATEQGMQPGAPISETSIPGISILEIYPEVTILLILTSVLLAILQYFNTTHKDCITDTQILLKDCDLNSNNWGMKKLGEDLEGLLNVDIISLDGLIQLVYCGLLAQTASFFAFQLLENISVFNSITSCLTGYILFLYLWGGCALFRMKRQKNSNKLQQKTFLDSYNLVKQTLSDNKNL